MALYVSSQESLRNENYNKYSGRPRGDIMQHWRLSECANAAISFGGGYLADPNIGVQGSRGAAAIPLLATLITWGRTGIVDRIDRAMPFFGQE